MRNGIAAVLIVKDEEKVLERCLLSLKGMDQIVVLDTGSTDRTMEIARAHTDDVYTTEPIEPFDFSVARNRALAHAKQDWILTIDADEVLRPGGLEQIRKALWREPHASGFMVNFVLYDEEGKNPSRLPKHKIFKRGHFEWRFRVHEQLFALGRDLKVKNLLQVSIEHLPVADKQARQEQNMELLKLAVNENPEYVRNIRQLGMQHYQAAQWEPALENLRKYLSYNAADRLDRSETLIHVGLALGNLDRYEESIQAFDDAQKIAPERREVLYHMGVVFVKGRSPEQAVEAFEKCLAIPVSSKPDFYLNVESVWDGSAVLEALAFARKQVAEGKAAWAKLQAEKQRQQAKETP